MQDFCVGIDVPRNRIFFGTTRSSRFYGFFYDCSDGDCSVFKVDNRWFALSTKWLPPLVPLSDFLEELLRLPFQYEKYYRKGDILIYLTADGENVFLGMIMQITDLLVVKTIVSSGNFGNVLISKFTNLINLTSILRSLE